jgi:hypothetical protein
MTTHGIPKPNRGPTRTMRREGGALSGDGDAGDRRSDPIVQSIYILLRMTLASFHVQYIIRPCIKRGQSKPRVVLRRGVGSTSRSKTGPQIL